MRDNGCTDRSNVIEIFEPVAFTTSAPAESNFPESDREGQRHIMVVGSPGGHSSQSRWKLLVRLQITSQHALVE
jgi:hypothetical protein